MVDSGKMAEWLSALGETFDREISDALAEVYSRALSDLTDDELDRGMGLVIRNCRFFPKPVEILEYARGGAAPAKDRALLAFHSVYDGASAYSSIKLDPVTAATIEAMGGWPAFCRPEQDEHWHRKEFVDLWVAYDRQRETLGGPRLLMGIHDAENLERGYLRHVSREALSAAGMADRAIGQERNPEMNNFRALFRGSTGETD